MSKDVTNLENKIRERFGQDTIYDSPVWKKF